MFLSIIILLLCLAIIFFHYLQGFFSATLSAICAVIAAAVAIGYHESLVSMLAPTRFADEGNALTLAILFGVTYIFLRFIFDKLIPGNVRLDSVVDKIGAAIMGIVAAIFCTGVLAIAAESLPFGASVLGFSRYPISASEDVHVPGGAGGGDYTVFNFLTVDNLDGTPVKLLVPVDDWTLGAVSTMSSGSLSGRQPLTNIHPDYLQELYGNQLGIEPGARHSAWNYGGKEQVTIGDPGRIDSIPEVDAELKLIRLPGNRKVAPLLTPSAAQVLLLVPCTINAEAAEAGGPVFRVSTGSVRLVLPDRAGGEDKYKDFYPVGTADEKTRVLYSNKPDDPIYVDVSDGSGSAVFAFLVPKDDILQDPKSKGPEKIADGSFLEVKRLARRDLSGVVIASHWPPGAFSTVERKVGVAQNAPNPATGAPASKAPPAPPKISAAFAALFQVDRADISNLLAVPVNGGDREKGRLDTYVQAAMHDGKFDTLTVHVDEPVSALNPEKGIIRELYVPPGKEMIQVGIKPGADSWAWASKLGAITIADASGTAYPVQGAWGIARMHDQTRFFVQYSATDPLKSIDPENASPTSIWLAFLVPDKADVKELELDGKPFAEISLPH